MGGGLGGPEPLRVSHVVGRGFPRGGATLGGRVSLGWVGLPQRGFLVGMRLWVELPMVHETVGGASRCGNTSSRCIKAEVTE